MQMEEWKVQLVCNT